MKYIIEVDLVISLFEGKLSYASSKWQPLQGGDDKSSQPLETIPKQSLIETDLSVACTETDTCELTMPCIVQYTFSV